MIQACDQKFLGKQASFNRSIATDRYSARRCLQSEIRKKNGIQKHVIPKSSIVKGKTWIRFQLRIFSYESITSQNHTIALNVIISWKGGKDLVEIQQACIIILVLTFSFQLTLKDNIGTNEIHVRCIKSIWFCPVEFNPTYPANKNRVFSSCELDTFGKIWLIQVSSIATYGNKSLSRSDRVALVMKSRILADRSSSNRIRL